MELHALNGFRDVLPEEVGLWRQVEETARDIFARFHFQEIRLPILEKTELFTRSIGETTDIVEKEMYTFTDKKVTMRPEATASLLRAYIEHSLHAVRPVQRLFTIGPMFRHERPQKGRLRQFHQLDVEVLGSDQALIDAELMAMGALLLRELGIHVRLEINSLGCPQCRPGFRARLLEFLASRQQHLCGDCQRRSSSNPLRVLDCKNPICRGQVADAPSILEHLCPECTAHFAAVETGLQQLGIAYQRNKFMVRGLDYYCRTTFEFITADLGAQAAVAAGGRYDGLIEQLGGPKKTPGIGFAMGIERLILLLQQQEKNTSAREIDLFVAALGEQAITACFTLVQQLRQAGWRVGVDYAGRSLKSQMKQADKCGAGLVLIVGDNELAAGQAQLRNMRTQQQQMIALQYEKIIDTLRSYGSSSITGQKETAS